VAVWLCFAGVIAAAAATGGPGVNLFVTVGEAGGVVPRVDVAVVVVVDKGTVDPLVDGGVNLVDFDDVDDAVEVVDVILVLIGVVDVAADDAVDGGVTLTVCSFVVVTDVGIAVDDDDALVGSDVLARALVVVVTTGGIVDDGVSLVDCTLAVVGIVVNPGAG
jgi:hypothetical protein